ncbi:MAG: radical SAM protein, partial [Cyclobacteriaceae bacterium]|nr:radical SAM protein [Cyclobacteriaceae bacterium]
MRNNPSIVYGLKARYYMLRLWLQIAMLAVKRTASAGQAFDLVKKINEMKNKLVDRRPIRKLVKADGKVFWNLNAPAWPSPAFDQYFLFTIDRLLAKKEVEGERVRFAMIAITKKCPLSCEHCFEWDEINKKEVLDLDTLKKIVAKYQRLGAAQFLLGGGEPLSRFHDLVELIKTAAPTSAFWITTSGFNITEQKARLLKQAGLSGMAISLDHFDKTKHNIFRGHSASYDFVKKAVEACHKTGLALSLSVCTTRNFVTMDNLMDYARLARDWGIGFIQLLEPRAVGRYKNQDVELS